MERDKIHRPAEKAGWGVGGWELLQGTAASGWAGDGVQSSLSHFQVFPESQGNTDLFRCFIFQDFLPYSLGSVSRCAHFFQALGWQQSENCLVFAETTKSKRQTAAIWQNS